ncbi:unnamed protein product [Darwinula stevensoni]|uniref:Fatty acid hydroxylase domain-containing protein n=1 Tax=Darwinula stevensoni TaxID=69355 RepID=A0A7R8XJU1_9CRUS|nr:unnamed protein product [Darwinula stevensoni]CAG0894543.1 unnamed protein product [Darwinula stevensoni]
MFAMFFSQKGMIAAVPLEPKETVTADWYREKCLPEVFDGAFYLPTALLGVPPSHILVHTQMNLMYQFWIHTETISSLGLLEYIINTPSHHRVHHGCNRYCIDKNYAGVLIIWDRIFGTFEPEGEQVVYGLTHAVSTFNPIKLQHKAPMKKYRPKSPRHVQVYAAMQFLFGVMIYAQFMTIHKAWHFHQALLFLGYMGLSMLSLGMMLENDTRGPRIELLRFYMIIWRLTNKQKQS